MNDKRAEDNKNLYNENDKKIERIIKAYDFKKIETENKEIIEEIGTCPISTSNTVETLEEGDCMCIGLKVSAPEAAIADPSRLKVEEIYPTYISADSFLESAKFNLEAGMFKDNKGKLAEDAA